MLFVYTKDILKRAADDELISYSAQAMRLIYFSA